MYSSELYTHFRDERIARIRSGQSPVNRNFHFGFRAAIQYTPKRPRSSCFWHSLHAERPGRPATWHPWLFGTHKNLELACFQRIRATRPRPLPAFLAQSASPQQLSAIRSAPARPPSSAASLRRAASSGGPRPAAASNSGHA